MIRIILTLCLFFIGANAYSQAPLIIRNDGKTTALDSNLFVGKSFRPPAFNDTTQANQSIKVLDSSGRIIFTRDSSTLWVRNVGKYWQKLVSGSGVTTLQQAFNAAPTANPDINAGNNTFLIAGDNDLGGVSRLIVGNNQGAQLYSKLDNTSYVNAKADGTIEISSLSTGSNSQKLVMNESKSYLVSGGNSGSDTSLTKLGIGTLYPEAPLDVSGAPRFRTDSAQIGYVWTAKNTNGQGEWRVVSTADSSTYFTTYRADTMRSNIYLNKVPYTGAYQDVDLGAFKLNAQAIKINGTNGAGHIHLKHQASDATASGQITALFADANGDLKWKNDNLYYTTLKTSGNTANRVYTFPDSTGTVALLSNVATKLNITDTANMRVRLTAGTGIGITGTYPNLTINGTDTSNISNRINAKQDTATSWKTGGNFGVNAGQFIGSINNSSLRFRTNNTERMILDSTGSLGIATSAPNSTYKLDINGKTIARDEIRLINNNKLLFNYSNNTTDGFGITQNASNLFSIRNYNFAYNVLSAIDINSDSAHNGLIGIKQNNPLSTLDIVGTMRNSQSAFLATSSGNVGIGTTTPNSTSILDVSSTTKGVLIPRMTTTQRDAISTPATGLMIYNTTDSSHYTYDGVRWNRELSANGLQTITGTSQGGSSANGILDLAQIWNTTGTPTAIKLNVTNTASNTNSNLMDLQVGGTSQFRVHSSGLIRANSGIVAGGTATVNTYNAAFIRDGGNATTTGTHRVFYSNMGVSPSSGTSVFNQFEYSGTINQTGGANGITRGLYVNPTLTAAADWRSVEWSNNSGWGLYGAGTAPNLLNGRLYIPTGSYDLPSLSFSNGTNTGLYSPLTNNIGLKTGTNNAIILENQGVNLMQNSENLGASPTVLQNITVSIPGNIVAPDGTLTANLAVPNTSLNQHRFYRIYSTTSPFTMSVYAKSAGYNFISFGWSGGLSGDAIIFDIVNGTISGTAGNHTAQIENVGNGWYRCSISYTISSGASSVSRWIIVRNANSTANYNGDSTSGVYLWGWQMEENTSSTSYIKTLATAVTRPQAVSILGQNLYGNLITRKLGSPSLTDFALTTDYTDRLIIKSTSGNILVGGSVDGGQRLQVIGATQTGSSADGAVSISQTWNTTGNPAAIRLNVTNTASGSTASLLDLQVGGTSYFTVDKGAKITQFATNTAAGTTGNQTINRPTGTVNIAAGGTTVTVTNNLVTTSSLVFAVIRTNDATADIKNVVPGAGSFTINLNTVTTAETSIGFWVIN